MEAQDVDASRILVAEWDGFIDLYPTIFHISALDRDGKIYISSSSTHSSLHVIHDLKQKSKIE